VDLRKLSKNL